MRVEDLKCDHDYQYRGPDFWADVTFRRSYEEHPDDMGFPIFEFERADGELLQLSSEQVSKFIVEKARKPVLPTLWHAVFGWAGA